MGDFKRPGGFGGNKGGFRKGGFGRDDRSGFSRSGPRDFGQKMYDAVCSSCGKPCQVPFRPDGRKPVYCNDCFGSQRRGGGEGGGRNSFEPRGNERGRFNSAPSAGASDPANGEMLQELKRQVNAMNAKLDTVLRLVESMQRPATAPVAPTSTAKPTPALAAPAVESKPKELAKKAPAKKAPVKKAAKKK